MNPTCLRTTAIGRRGVSMTLVLDHLALALGQRIHVTRTPSLRLTYLATISTFSFPWLENTSTDKTPTRTALSPSPVVFASLHITGLMVAYLYKARLGHRSLLAPFLASFICLSSDQLTLRDSGVISFLTLSLAPLSLLPAFVFHCSWFIGYPL
ncbi:hypothetical protein BOTBODRAFT_35801 [Botryobasidium botryosum FD-172 SS1]|uniref:Uncharacterized protein n=1 Tax=Botryobasidium botryosum (strain FD-172 SS1) TaxID=930990 RepID=A0A067M533_BOTB1|nr:hypothetical protein BOTBODRAFT_35801 [Botryobasidium botryosum FD-172 SS1]